MATDKPKRTRRVDPLRGPDTPNPLGVKRPPIFHSAPLQRANALTMAGATTPQRLEPAGRKDKDDETAAGTGDGETGITKTELISRGKALGISEAEIRRRIEGGEITPTSTHGDRMRFDEDEAETWLQLVAEEPTD